MNIGLVVHSHTGNTEAVAIVLQQQLVESGHSVTLQRVRALNEDTEEHGLVQLVENPDVSPFTALILAAPVRAFALSPVMKAWLAGRPALQNKNVACFVTQHFPYAWMGGSNALRQFQQGCKENGAIVAGTAVVNWSNKNRQIQISTLVDRFEELFR
ncbi:MAG: flavodoxin [Spirochaetes bacterium]|nr:flavodoxin [Spirochaetota bacterium]